MNLKGLILIATSLLLSGCAGSNGLSREMAAMQDEPVATVVAAWGQPDSKEPFGDEIVLIWYDRATAEVGVAATVIVCERMLAVTEQGTVTGWRWRGDHCNNLSEGARSRSLTASR